MARWLIARREIIGPVAEVAGRLTGAPQELLQAATGSPPTQPAGDGSFPITLSGRRAGLQGRGHVRATVGAALHEPHWLSVPLRWEASALLPAFGGSLELEELSPLRSQLVLVGHYRPPLGPLGALGDFTVMEGVAQRTAEQLIAGVARELAAAVKGESPAGAPSEPRLTVGDVMTPHPATFDERVPLRTAAAVLLRSGHSGAPVLAGNGQLMGVLSETDLLARQARRPPADHPEADPSPALVGDVCTRPAVTTEVGTSVRDAARVMLERDIGRLVVLDGAELAGIVTRHDVLKALHREDAAVEADVLRLLCARGLDETVDVAVEEGRVTLRGILPTPSAREDLATLVAEVDGVAAVTVTDPGYDPVIG